MSFSEGKLQQRAGAASALYDGLNAAQAEEDVGSELWHGGSDVHECRQAAHSLKQVACLALVVHDDELSQAAAALDGCLPERRIEVPNLQSLQMFQRYIHLRSDADCVTYNTPIAYCHQHIEGKV